MADKSDILREIKRIARENGGKAPGVSVFERQSAIRRNEWYPHIWLRWSDALFEAGFTPNKLQSKIDDDIIFGKYIELTRALARFPVSGELRRTARNDESFPAHTVFNRFGGKNQLIARLYSFVEGKENFTDIEELCSEYLSPSDLESDSKQKGAKVSTGFVYLMKSGRHFKIGKTSSILRRHGELKIQIPVPPTTVHSIETDDPSGVEAYWHRRFVDKRGEGEWFELTREDIAAFKRWKRLI